ncbi:MAG TPA: hypothetical protein VFH63_05865 [candidate division Zixibacteria bacterium]|nr:hypothetical protein [candidate division Zixibacteria bacterium]
MTFHDRPAPTLHRVRIPRGAVPTVSVGSGVRPDQVLATLRQPGAPIHVPVAAALRRKPEEVVGLLTVRPGATVSVGDVIAREPGGRTASAPIDGILLGVSATDGSALLAPFGAEETVIGHVRGTVRSVEPGAITVEVPAVLLRGVGGSGEAVHGELVVAVHAPQDELRAAAIDVSATGRIVVGGSRASAETLTRARAMGVAGMVLGGVLDKELRDFEAIQRRRREIGGLTGSFGVLLLEGYGKVGIDPQRFAWLRAHAGRMASLFGAEGLLYVYDAQPIPWRRPLPRVGERVVAHRRPFQGRTGVLVAELEDLHATPAGVPARMGLVRFEDGRLAPVPLANLEATLPAAAAE